MLNIVDTVSLGILQDISTCDFYHFQTCGVVDKSESSSRWSVVVEDYSVNSTSKQMCIKTSMSEVNLITV